MRSGSPSRRRPFWGDVRFFLGILLVAVSVVGVWFVVTSARETSAVFAAARTILPGEEVAAADVRRVEAALGAAADLYLTGDVLTPGLVATRTIPVGELVPRAAVGEPASVTTTSVVVPSSVDVPASVVPGSVVEVWAAPPLERGVFDAPRILVPDATVVAVDRDDRALGGGVAVELVIPRADVADVLAAIGGGAALSVIPAVAR